MKNRILSVILSCAVFLSTMVSPAFAAGDLVPSNYGALVKGITYSGAFASASAGVLFSSFIDWASSGASFKGSDINNSFNKTYNTNITNTGTTNNYRYNNTTNVNNYQAINTTYNNYYNPVTNNYNTYNSISYNSTYNTYKITNNNYNSYVTNNNTYVSYYVIDINTEKEYYYEIYYQLPDGRNSFDLEPEDVWGTYFMYNATNYREVVEDDGKTLALWHLDGDAKNEASSSYTGTLSGVPENYVETQFTAGVQLLNDSKAEFKFPLTDDIKTIEFRMKSSVSYGEFPFSFGDYTAKESSVKTNSRLIPFINHENHGKFVTSHDSSIVNYWVSVALVRDSENSEKWSLYLNGKYFDDFYSGSDRWDYKWTTSSGKEYTYSYFLNPDGYFHFRNYVGYNSVNYVVYDEIRLSNTVLYKENYTPRTQPFDTNKVLVVPDTADMTETTIAVKSSVPVAGLRVGGVRPTFPANGDVYVVEEKGIVKDVQQYQSDGWFSVTASLYIDGEWKLFVGFDISGFGLNKPDSPGGGTGPGGSGDSGGSGSGGGGSGGGDSGGSSGFWDKLLQSVFGGVLSVLASLLSGLLTLLSTILTMLLGLVGYIGIFLPFLPSGVVTLIGGGVFIVLALIVVKFIGNLL